MKFVYRIAFNATPQQLAEMESLGLNPKVAPNASFPGDDPLVAFDLAEDHPNGRVFFVLLKEWGRDVNVVWTEFTPPEIESARFLQLSAWQNGFPQPQDLHEYVKVTYDLTKWCSTCSRGKIQNAPFRIKIEPKWNRRGIMTLFWVGDEFFVPPAIWETVFKPFGIRCRSVANRKGIELKTVVQLVVEEEVDLVTDGLTPIHCDGCGLDKYHWVTRGMFPALRDEPKSAIVRTKQVFGDGWGVRPVLISQDLYRAMKSHNVRGAEFTPVDAALPAIVA